MHPDSIAISAEKGTASLNGIMRNVQSLRSMTSRLCDDVATIVLNRDKVSLDPGILHYT